MYYILFCILILPVNLSASDGDQAPKTKPLAQRNLPSARPYLVDLDNVRAGIGALEMTSNPQPRAPICAEGRRRSEIVVDIDWGLPPMPRQIAAGRSNNQTTGFILEKLWVEWSTICCFISQKWFKTAGFLASVGVCALAGVAYGTSDLSTKNALNLTIFILTVASVACKQFEGCAYAAVHRQEHEYGMFNIS